MRPRPQKWPRTQSLSDMATRRGRQDPWSSSLMLEAVSDPNVCDWKDCFIAVRTETAQLQMK